MPQILVTKVQLPRLHSVYTQMGCSFSELFDWSAQKLLTFSGMSYVEDKSQGPKAGVPSTGAPKYAPPLRILGWQRAGFARDGVEGLKAKGCFSSILVA